MAIPTLNAVGFCAHYSEQGDWAFDYALKFSREHAIQLNVFHFLTDPYDPSDHKADQLKVEERAKMIIEKEKELRMYYDNRSGDFLDVGFRLCEDNDWTELHRCLLIREFQVLVLGNVKENATFAGRPIAEFANAFICPVILVGPDSPDQIQLNEPAALIADELGIPEGSWSRLEMATA